MSSFTHPNGVPNLDKNHYIAEEKIEVVIFGMTLGCVNDRISILDGSISSKFNADTFTEIIFC